MIPEMRYFSYEEQLRECGLTTDKAVKKRSN